MSRRKIEHRLFKRGLNQPRLPLKKDKLASGSVEIKHLDFIGNLGGSQTYLGELADDDVVALGDASDSTSMRAVKLGDFKAYVSGSQATGKSGSIQFNTGGDFGGTIAFTTDGTHLTSSAQASPGTYVIRLTSGSTGGSGNKTYGPSNGVTAQLLHFVGTGSSDFVFFLSDGTSTGLPSSQSINFFGTAQEFRVEAISGVTDWRDVAENFAAKIKAQLDTNTGIATVTSSSAGSITGTSSITVAYNTIGGGARVGGGRDGSRNLHDPHSQPTTSSPFNLNLDPSAGASPIQTGGSNGISEEPSHTGGFVQTITSGSEPKIGKLYFTSEALGISPKHQQIVSDTAGVLEIQASNTGSGVVTLRGGSSVNIRTVSNKGFIFDTVGTNPALIDGRDSANLQRANIQFRTINDNRPVITLASGSTHIFGTTAITTTGSTGTYRFDLTSGSTGFVGATYGPPQFYETQYLQVASTGSEDYLFFLSDGTSTNKPTAHEVNIFPTNNLFEIRVEAVAGITDWRDVADNFFEQMKLELETRAGVATVTSSSAGSITATASITIAYNSIGGGIQIGSARDGGRSLDSNYFVGTLNNQSADPSSPSHKPIAGGDGIGDPKNQDGEPGVNGVTVNTVVLGADDSTTNANVRLHQANAKLYFDNGTTYYAGTTSNVQFLTASAARIGTLDVEEIVSRSTSKNSLEIGDKLVIAGVSASAPDQVVGAGFQLGGTTAVQGTGSNALFSLTMGDPDVNEGSMVMKVNDTRIASINSGSFYRSSGMVGDGMLAVTGAISASYIRSHIVHGGTVSGSSLTVQRAVLNELNGTSIVTVDNIKTGSVATGHIADGQVTHDKLTGTPAQGVLTLDLTAFPNFGLSSFSGGESLKIGDGSTTLTFTGVDAGGSDATGSLDFGVGSDRGTLEVTTELSRKINNSSLNAIAQHSASTITITPSASVILTLQEDPDNNGQFGSNASYFDFSFATAATTAGVTADNIQTGSVNTPHVVANAITNAKIANNTVTVRNMATGSVATPQISDLSVTHAKLAIGAATADNLGTGSVLTAHIADAQVTHDKLFEESVTPGTYVFRMGSGSVGTVSSHTTYGPCNVTAQVLHCVGTGSSDFIFFLSDGTSTQLPSQQSGLNFFGTAQEIRVEAVAGITDWRDVIDNFYEKIKLHMETINGIATVTSSSAGSITGTSSITVAYNSIPGGIKVGSGNNSSRSIHIAHSQPADNSRFNVSLDPTLGGSQIQTNFASSVSPEPDGNGGFPETLTSGSSANSAVRRDNMATGSVDHDHLAGAVLTADNMASGSVNTPHFVDGAVGMDQIATGSVTGLQLNHDVVRNGSDANGGLNMNITPGTFVFRLTSGSTGFTGATYGPAAVYRNQFLTVASSGSEEYLFFMSDGTSTNEPLNNGTDFSYLGQTNFRQIRVEAVSGITDWRDVADNIFEQMKLELDTRTSIATVTSSSAGSVTATASITVAFNSIAGGVAVCGGSGDSSPALSNRLLQGDVPAIFTSYGHHPIGNNAGNDVKGHAEEPANTGVFVETTTSGSTARRLKIQFVRRDFARADGSNISGSVPVKGTFASDAIPTPFTTASLSAQPMSGTLEVYFNGVLLLGDHAGENAGGPTRADYRLVTASANAYQVRLNEELALDSDDVLTITYYSGSNPL